MPKRLSKRQCSRQLQQLSKLMTGMLAEKISSQLERENVLPSEQKGCRKWSRETKDQLLIDKKSVKRLNPILVEADDNANNF